uniref:NADH-ubiquinone oxidoreductase chain 2 n=1 Tax=Tridacna derasa TaxID=80831 RepID=A0A3G3C745_TRIDE|nr:NADH dehydrogenase subunit 2 [Tridacna derasa]AYP72638.1 NADH dehydrogenase subunit 2 [Tridacna derasa]
MFSGFGVMTALISKGVIGVMMGMEIAFFGVIPLMLLSGIKKPNNLNEAEAALVYFLFQSMGSMFLFLSLVLVIFSRFQFAFVWLMFILGVALKLGIFPFHTWVVTVSGLSSWLGILFVLVLMKLAPYWMLSGLGLPLFTVIVLVVLSCITTMLGSIAACNQSTLRGVLGYSSLSQSGFMMSLSLVNVYYYLWYFMVYSIIMCVLLISCWRKSSALMVMSLLASLSGVPPLMGMYMKFGGLYCLSGVSISLCVFLMLWSLFGFFYYFNALIEIFYSNPEVGKKDWGLIMSNVFLGPVVFIGLAPMM